ncbi:hypothetical protein HY798_04205 [Candidatus Falkowbacteria bacterium]|nr:hypothetical protein [Candidatus Falkowbacteria bacterium]
MARKICVGATTAPAEREETTEGLSFFNPDNRVTRMAVIALMAVVSLVNTTIALNNFLGYNAMGKTWYWTALLAVGVVSLVAWLKKQTDITPFSTVAKIIMVISLIMLLLSAIWPGVNVRNAAASVRASANGGVVYGPGKHSFRLEAQGISEPIQLLPEKGKYNISSADNNFQLLTSAGQLVSIWDKKNWPKAGEIQIIAGNTDQTIAIEVW